MSRCDVAFTALFGERRGEPLAVLQARAEERRRHRELLELYKQMSVVSTSSTDPRDHNFGEMARITIGDHASISAQVLAVNVENHLDPYISSHGSQVRLGSCYSDLTISIANDPSILPLLHDACGRELVTVELSNTVLHGMLASVSCGVGDARDDRYPELTFEVVLGSAPI